MEVSPTQIVSVDSAALRRYMEVTPESRYLIIDVRQPDEYNEGHIPGANSMPLGVLEQQLFTLPPDRDVIFYCFHGPRATVAAMLVEEGEVLKSGRIYLYHGGMRAWDGEAVAVLPNLKQIAEVEKDEVFLYQAMEMEKGAGRFYAHWRKKLIDTSIEPVFNRLQNAERGHARLLYQLWVKGQKEPQPFEQIYDSLTGDIIEGGRSYDTVMAEVAGHNEIRVLEFALHLEWCAYDLYRNRAEAAQDSEFKKELLTLAQGEKKHIRQLIDALDLANAGT